MLVTRKILYYNNLLKKQIKLATQDIELPID